MSRNQKLQSGQSMIEVVAALAVVIIVLVGLVGGVTYSIRNANFARNQTLATQYAQEWIEEVRDLRDESPDLFFTSDCTIENNDPDGRGIFIRDRICDLVVDPLSGETIMNVVVTVSWSEGSQSHGSKLETTLTNWK